jgi:hypothetical protein
VVFLDCRATLAMTISFAVIAKDASPAAIQDKGVIVRTERQCRGSRQKYRSLPAPELPRYAHHDGGGFPGLPRYARTDGGGFPGLPRYARNDGGGFPGLPRYARNDGGGFPGLPRYAHHDGGGPPGLPRCAQGDERKRDCRAALTMTGCSR